MTVGARRWPALVLVAHGTRSPRGVEMIAALAESVSRTVPTVRTAFVDVLGPSPAEVLGDLGGRPAVVVPAFLASGYHVHVDVPSEVRAGGYRIVDAAFESATAVVTPAIGPHPELAGIMALRLRTAGWRPGDAVVFAAAGSSDPNARNDVDHAAALLGARLGLPVDVGYIATGVPGVAAAVADQRRRTPSRRVFIASYLLAHGLFQHTLHDTAADGVADPIGVHPAVVRLIADRYRTAAARVPALGE